MLFKKYKNIISKNNLKSINHAIDNKDFPLFLTIKSATGIKCNPTFEHCVIKVPELRKDQLGINSGFYPLFQNIFETFCNKNKIQYSEIYLSLIHI